jgi:hypothetical protein
MIYGINSAAEKITDSHFTNFKVYVSNPRNKESEPCEMHINASSPDDLAEHFIRKMGRHAPGVQYWVKLYNGKNEEPNIFTFTKETGAPASYPGATALGSPEQGAGTSDLLELTASNTRLEIELRNAQEKIAELEGDILDLEDELDNFEGDEDPLTGTLVNILGSFAKPGASALGGNDVLVALTEIKAVAPEAEGLLIKLGALAKENPEQLKIFVETLNKNLQ